MNGSDQVFAVIERVVSMRGQSADAIGHLFGVVPTKVAEWSNEYMDMFVADIGPADRPFENIEIRVPVHPEAARGLVLLSLDPKALCVGPADVMGRYGRSPEILVPTPRQPPGSPIYYVYRQAWGDLRFGIAPQAPECLVSVVIDWEVRR